MAFKASQVTRLRAAGYFLALSLVAPSPANAFEQLPSIWTGVYAGIHGAANFVSADLDGIEVLQSTTPAIGAHLGVQFDFGSIVAGIEADLNYETLSETAHIDGYPALADDSKVEVTSSGSVRVRAGIPAGAALLYATAGYAWADFNAEPVGAGGSGSHNGLSLDGIVYGVGVEAFVMPNVTLRLEALRFDYGSADLPTGPQPSDPSAQLDVDATVVRAGLSYRFN